MKKLVTLPIVCAALVALTENTVRAADHSATSHAGNLARQESVLVNIKASVEAVDYTNREVSLKGPLGNTVTFVVDPKVKRFKEIKVGDYVQADYYVSVAAELREPTAEEKEHPLQVLGAAGKAPPGTSPAAGGLRCFKVVTTIEGLDRPTETVTVKGPRGNYLTARVADPSRLTQVHIGDTVVVTYTEAVAISLEKVQKKSLD